MEKHHKLRRPAGSSIHACNICGIEGHQAAQCTNGTVNWAQKWGRNAFKPTEGGSAGASKEPDYADLAAQARAFAAKRLADEQAAKKIAEEVSDFPMMQARRGLKVSVCSFESDSEISPHGFTSGHPHEVQPAPPGNNPSFPVVFHSLNLYVLISRLLV